MTTEEETKKKPRGRPRKKSVETKPKEKLVLKQSPTKDYDDLFDEWGYAGVWPFFGINDKVRELIDYLWKRPEAYIIATDPTIAVIDNLHRKMASRQFSVTRWDAVPTSGFIEQNQFPFVITTKEYEELVINKVEASSPETEIIVL